MTTWPPPAATPPVPPSPDSPAAAPVTPRKRWIVVLVGVLALVLVLGIAGTVLFFTRTYPPLAATYDFTDDLHDGNLSSATSQLCNRLATNDGGGGFEAFAARVARADNVSVNLLSVDRHGSEATVDFSTTSGDDRSVKYTLRLLHEDGDWRPCGLV